MDEATYGRGQVEWALWRGFRIRSFAAEEKVPKIFRTRIKRLLEIDRDLDLSGAEVPPEASYAFAPPPSDQSGDTGYRSVDGGRAITFGRFFELRPDAATEIERAHQSGRSPAVSYGFLHPEIPARGCFHRTAKNVHGHARREDTRA